MSETYTCKECETLYDDTDGDIEKGLCDKCLDMLAEQKRQRERLTEMFNITKGKI